MRRPKHNQNRQNFYWNRENRDRTTTLQNILNLRLPPKHVVTCKDWMFYRNVMFTFARKENRSSKTSRSKIQNMARLWSREYHAISTADSRVWSTSLSRTWTWRLTLSRSLDRRNDMYAWFTQKLLMSQPNRTSKRQWRFARINILILFLNQLLLVKFLFITTIKQLPIQTVHWEKCSKKNRKLTKFETCKGILFNSRVVRVCLIF